MDFDLRADVEVKHFITNGDIAGVITVIARRGRTDARKRHVSAFLVRRMLTAPFHAGTIFLPSLGELCARQDPPRREGDSDMLRDARRL